MKKPMIYFVCPVFFVLISNTKTSAQSAEVNIEQDSTISKLMSTKIEIDTKNYSSNFYTIQLFYGDFKRTLEVYEDFKKSFPDWEVDYSFETPNYKVQVGQFKNYYYGLKKLNEIKKAYPAAFLLEIKN